MNPGSKPYLMTVICVCAPATGVNVTCPCLTFFSHVKLPSTHRPQFSHLSELHKDQHYKMDYMLYKIYIYF